MQQFLSMTADRIVVMLQDRDAKTAEEIILDDDKLDALHHKTFDLALSDKWTGSRQQLIDVVLLGRFMERLGDQRRVGLPPRRVHRVRLRSEQGAVARRGRRRRVTTTARCRHRHSAITELLSTESPMNGETATAARRFCMPRRAVRGFGTRIIDSIATSPCVSCVTARALAA